MKKGTCLLCDHFWTCNKRKANGGCGEYIRKSKKAKKSKEKHKKQMLLVKKGAKI